MGDNINDLTFPDSPIKRWSGARQGRRAAVPEPEVESPPLSRPRTEDVLLLEEEPRRARASAPARRTGGWGEQSQSRAKTAKSILARAGMSGKDFDESDEDPIIPDLDDVEQEDFALKVADAPTVALNRVATYKELDNDLFKHAAFATLEEIDLRVLTRCLESETALRETDDHWSWETLFTELAGQMQSEWMPGQQEEVDRAASDRPYTAFNRFPV